MTRSEALTKLLALGELSLAEIHEITRWEFSDVCATLEQLRNDRVTKYLNNGTGLRLYVLSDGCPNPFDRSAA